MVNETKKQLAMRFMGGKIHTSIPRITGFEWVVTLKNIFFLFLFSAKKNTLYNHSPQFVAQPQFKARRNAGNDITVYIYFSSI